MSNIIEFPRKSAAPFPETLEAMESAVAQQYNGPHRLYLHPNQWAVYHELLNGVMGTVGDE